MRNVNDGTPIERVGTILGRASLCAFSVLGLSIGAAALVFQGPMADYFMLGITLSVFGTAVLSAVSGGFSGLCGAIPAAKSAPAAVIAVMVGIIAEEIAPGASLPATCLVAIALASGVTGCLLLTLGAAGIGQRAHELPRVLAGGFAAATGVMLVVAGARLADGLNDDPIATWMDGDPADHFRLSIAALIALVYLACLRARITNLVLPLVFLGSVLGFYLGIAAQGPSTYLRWHGDWLLQPGQTDQADQTESPWPGTFAVLEQTSIDWLLLAALIPYMLATGAVVAVSIALSVRAIVDRAKAASTLREEFELYGVAHLIAGCWSGLPGYHTLSTLPIAGTLSSSVRPVATGVAAACLLALISGLGFIYWLPLPLLGALVAALGIDLILKWLVDERSRLSTREYIILVVMIITAAGAGFLASLCVGAIGVAAIRRFRNG